MNYQAGQKCLRVKVGFTSNKRLSRSVNLRFYGLAASGPGFKNIVDFWRVSGVKNIAKKKTNNKWQESAAVFRNST